ncbi:hypothetical protein Tco_0151608 [Tanacetum coccineum]
MSRSNSAGGKNRLTKAYLICSQVAIPPGISSLNHTLASSARDNGKSLSLIASALVLPYQNIRVDLKSAKRHQILELENMWMNFQRELEL